jgi:hypothetical protein
MLKMIYIVLVNYSFLGKYDGVTCFSCGMEMRSIKAEDDPWILHVKYSSKCTFVTQEKDPAFINAHAVDYSKLPRMLNLLKIIF